MASWMNKALNE